MINFNTFRPNTNFLSNSYDLLKSRNYLSKTSYTNLKPLCRDMFTFTGNTQLNRSLMEAFDNKEVCESVRDNAKEATADLKQRLETSLGDFIQTKNRDKTNQNFPIHHIETRIKTPESIREKVADRLGDAILSDVKTTFNPNRAKDIKKTCQDIIGARIVLGSSDSVSTLRILNKIIEDVENKKLRITGIESYQPDGKYENLAYFKIDDLKRLENVVNQNRPLGSEKVTAKINKKNTGYMALHLDLDLSDPNKYVSNKDGYFGEIQIVGIDVSSLKEVEDFCYKLKSNKDIKAGNVAYKPFSEYFLHYLNASPEIKANFDEYTSRAYIIQRKKEPKKQLNSSKKVILPTIEECGMTGKIPEQLDFNILYSMKNICDEIYKYTYDMN